tara:strand:+ start:536 stop:736 length:201 start_codon:yes stop_codon:yes gene_type:complete
MEQIVQRTMIELLGQQELTKEELFVETRTSMAYGYNYILHQDIFHEVLAEMSEMMNKDEFERLYLL